MSNNSNPTVESIIYRYFIKYNRLSGAIPYAFQDNNSNVLNIYIDLYGMYRTIYSRSFRTTITDYTSFTSTVVNMCAHYREFFKRIGVWTKIFIISSFNTPISTVEVIPDYNHTMLEKEKNSVISDMMNFNFELLRILSPYLPDIFFLETQFESSALMYELMTRESGPNLIISTDLYPLQLCTLFDNTAYIWPMKIFNSNNEYEDISPICPPRSHSEHNISYAYINRRKHGKTTSEQLEGSVTASNYVLLQALNQFKERDLKLLLNSRIATRVINETPGALEYKLRPMDIANSLEKFIATDPNFMVTLNNRYNALNVEYQHILYTNSVECSTLHYENLSDPDALNLINDKYFKNNPLDIFRI